MARNELVPDLSARRKPEVDDGMGRIPKDLSRHRTRDGVLPLPQRYPTPRRASDVTITGARSRALCSASVGEREPSVEYATRLVVSTTRCVATKRRLIGAHRPRAAHEDLHVGHRFRVASATTDRSEVSGVSPLRTPQHGGSSCADSRLRRRILCAWSPLERAGRVPPQMSPSVTPRDARLGNDTPSLPHTNRSRSMTRATPQPRPTWLVRASTVSSFTRLPSISHLESLVSAPSACWIPTRE
jgi:hypothetical protein